MTQPIPDSESISAIQNMLTNHQQNLLPTAQSDVTNAQMELDAAKARLAVVAKNLSDLTKIMTAVRSAQAKGQL